MSAHLPVYGRLPDAVELKAPPIWVGARFAVTLYGIEALDGRTAIPAAHLRELETRHTGWIRTGAACGYEMGEWVAALGVARLFHDRGSLEAAQILARLKEQHEPRGSGMQPARM